jgi:hypothetical protein
MSSLLYSLEDHFDALAEAHRGSASGWVSRGLRALFGVAGDFLQLDLTRRF